MFRSLALSLAVLSACAASARADFFDTSATILINNNVPVPGSVSNVNQIIGTSSGGFDFTNTTSAATGGSPNQSRNFVSVGSDLVVSYNQFGGGSVPATFNGQQLVKVFAVSGVSTAGAGGLTTNVVNSGTVGYFAIAPGSYNAFNPTTWGTAANLVASYTLVGPQNINQTPTGTGGGIPASAVNVIALNTASPVNSQGHFLGVENFNPGFITTNVFPPGTATTGEGIHVLVNQQVAFQGTTNPADPANNFRFLDPAGPTAGTGLAALNAFAALFGVGTFADVFGAGTGTGASFNPYVGPSLGQVPGSGDFGILSGDTEFPGFFTANQETPRVPEPATIAVFGLLAISAGAYGTVRRRVKAA